MRHEPECLLPDFDRGVWVCCCAQLRACKQRVRDSILGNYRASIVYGNGYEDGVQAARDAVAATFPADQATYRWRALAAIDALRNNNV